MELSLQTFLGWCLVANYAILLVWFLFFVFAHDFMYRFHAKWFMLPVETFDAIHYAGLAFFKLLVIVFNLTPFVVLYLAE